MTDWWIQSAPHPRSLLASLTWTAGSPFNHFNLFMNFDDLNARSKKLYVCGARSYGQEATGGHSGLTDDVSFSKKLHNWPIFTFSMF